MSFKTIARPYAANYAPGQYSYNKINDVVLFIKNEFVKSALSKRELQVVAKPDTLLTIQQALHDLSIPSVMDNHSFDRGAISPLGVPLESTIIEALTSYSDTFELLNHKILENWTVVDIIKLLSDSKKGIAPYPFMVPDLEFKFSGEEYYDLTKVVSTYLRFHTLNEKSQIKEFALHQFNKQAINNSDKEALQLQLSQWIDQLTKVKRKLLSHLTHYQEINELKAKNKKLDRLKELTAIKHKVYRFISIHGDGDIPKPSLFTLDKQKKKKYEAWQQLLNEVSMEANSAAEILEALNISCQETTSSYHNSILAIRKGLKSLNGYNSQNQNLVSDIQYLTEVINQINSSQLFNERIEDNAKSILIKIERIDNLIKALKLLEECRDIDGILHWYQLRSTLDKGTLSFLNQLNNCPVDEWKQQFDFFYLNQLLKHFNISQLTTSNENFQLKDAVNQVDRLIIDANQIKLTESIKEIKSISKKDYKSAVDGTSGADILLPYLSTVSMVQLNQELLNPKESKNSTIIYIDKSEPKPALLNDSYFLTRSKTQTSDSWIIHDLHITTELANTVASKQLEIAKALAHNLFPLLDMAVGFQFKNKNVLNLLHRHWQDELSNALTHLGGKEFEIKSVDDLTNFILSTDRPLHLLVQDHMINNKCTRLRWMAYATQDLIKAGAEIHNISSMDLFNDSTMALSSVLAEIGISPSHEASKKVNI